MIQPFRVLPVVFQGLGRFGDFGWMRTQPEFSRTLFVFNDNQAQFEAFERGERSGFSVGGGNAAIRPWRGEDPPRSAGIPTGDGGGYPVLNQEVRAVLARALDVVADLVDGGWYDSLVFSGNPETEMLGASIYSPHPEILRFVYGSLMAIAPGAPRPWRA